jgi:hypothetical protein
MRTGKRRSATVIISRGLPGILRSPIVLRRITQVLCGVQLLGAALLRGQVGCGRWPGSARAGAGGRIGFRDTVEQVDALAAYNR